MSSCVATAKSLGGVLLLSFQCLEEFLVRVFANKGYVRKDLPFWAQEVDPRNRNGCAVTEDASLGGAGGDASLLLEQLAEEEVGVRSTNDDSHERFARLDHVRVVQCCRECTTLEAGRGSSGFCAR
jgi:hypothetical protein